MKKVIVSIGIPAFNEEQNIENFLRSILKQKLFHVTLEKILVYSDASTDRTNEIVTKLSKKYSIIKLLKGTSRKGKYLGVSDIFKQSKSDVTIILDADIALAGETVIEGLTHALISDPSAVMVAGHNMLVRPKGFIAKVLHTHFVLWDYVRWSVPNYDLADNFYGTATAYRKRFAHSLKITSKLSDPHLYIYLSAKKVNGFRYCEQAKVLQYAPSTLKDLKKLLSRSIGKKDLALEKIFGEETVVNARHITTKAKLLGVWRCFLWQPFYTPFALVVSFYIGRLVRPEKVDKSAIWEINLSTKKPITYAN